MSRTGRSRSTPRHGRQRLDEPLEVVADAVLLGHQLDHLWLVRIPLSTPARYLDLQVAHRRDNLQRLAQVVGMLWVTDHAGLEHLLDRAIAGHHLRGRLVADSGKARQAVRGVTPEDRVVRV